MRWNRRTYLTALGGTATAGFAGCLSGGDEAGETSYDCTLEERDPVEELSHPAKGEEDAPVTVLVFKDYGCGGCASFETEYVPDLVAEYVDSGMARLEHRDFPIDANPDWSWPMANAARSVQDDAGDEAFFDFTAEIFAEFGDYSWELVGETAESVGADPCRVLSDGEYDTYRPVLEADESEATSLSLGGTPAVVVDGDVIDFSSLDELAERTGRAIENNA
ncbi:DsbA family protein [Haloferacaceae archaeon DSL9]